MGSFRPTPSPSGPAFPIGAKSPLRGLIVSIYNYAMCKKKPLPEKLLRDAPAAFRASVALQEQFKKVNASADRAGTPPPPARKAK